MRRRETKRACRYSVAWPVRVKTEDEPAWRDGQVVNLSVTGALLRLDHRYKVGQPVEVEIDFLTQPDSTTIVGGLGHIVRQDRIVRGASAVQFVIECGLSKRKSV